MTLEALAAATAAATPALAAAGFRFWPGVAEPYGMFVRADGVQVYWHDNGEEGGWMIVEADGNDAYWIGHGDKVPAALADIAATLSALAI